MPKAFNYCAQAGLNAVKTMFRPALLAQKEFYREIFFGIQSKRT
jgi:hypothetical protein